MVRLAPILGLLLILLSGCERGSTATPAGMIALFDGACPEGWSRYEPLDGRFPRGSPVAGGTGGREEHEHSFDITARTSRDGEHDHPLAGGEEVEVDPGYYGNIGLYEGHLQAYEEGGRVREKSARAMAITEAGGSHDHLISVQGDSASASSLPPYLELVFCKKE